MVHPIVFNNQICHSDVALAATRQLMSEYQECFVHSAGFFNINSVENGINCNTFGDSDSLGISSKQGDNAILNDFFNKESNIILLRKDYGI